MDRLSLLVAAFGPNGCFHSLAGNGSIGVVSRMAAFG